MQNFHFTDAYIANFFVHKVGNKLAEEDNFLTHKPAEVGEELRTQLCQYFLNNFKSQEFYQFHHHANLVLNEVYNYTSNIFDFPENLKDNSHKLATHLYNQSAHPKIKGGEFFVVHFKNIFLNGEMVDAIGLFKTENKDTFLDVQQVSDRFDLESKLGVSMNKLDKGCLIFDAEKPTGFLVSIVDNTNKNTEAQFWKDDFLNVLILNNEFHQTNEFLSIAKSYVTEQFTNEFEVSKPDQVELLNRSVDYFKKHEKFEKQEFEQEVFANESLIASFRKFEDDYKTNHQIEVDDSFDINKQAVKKQARVFKSVLKLDKNFHIYIHGNTEMIENGVEADGRKFYKLYYNEELL